MMFNKHVILTIVLGLSSLAYSQKFEKCIESQVYGYTIADEVSETDLKEGVNYLCSVKLNQVLHRAKIIIKDDAAQFYTQQIVAIGECLDGKVEKLRSIKRSKISTIYFVLEDEMGPNYNEVLLEDTSLLVMLGLTEEKTVLMDDTHESLNQEEMSQQLRSLICNAPRA